MTPAERQAIGAAFDELIVVTQWPLTPESAERSGLDWGAQDDAFVADVAARALHWPKRMSSKSS